MTEQEFRQQMQELYYLELAVKRDPKELAKITTKKQELRRTYRRSLFEQMQNNKERNKLR